MSYKRSRENRRRLKKLYKEKGNCYDGSGVYYNKNKNRYIRYNNGKKTKKYYKKYSNKRVRRYNGELNDSDYKKVFDYHWTLF